MRQTLSFCFALVAAALSLVGALQSAQNGPATRPAEFALRIADFAAMPITGLLDGTGNNAGSLARINVLREEPSATHRLFINDLTGPLYILDKTTKQVTTYLDFNGRGDRRGLFDRLPTETGLASGLISFEFDPDYAKNGRFYTIHLEDTALPGTLVPDNTSFPRLDVKGYEPTMAVIPPAGGDHEGVLIEWTDSNIANATFEGTARELLRIRLTSRIHPLGDLTFNPVARRGDPDWRVFYVACGDGGSGDQRIGLRLNPQRLDTMVGKILRIIPDLAEHPKTSVVSENGRYRVPADNPFVSVAGARPEIWAYGLRNPHRLSWFVDRANSSGPRLIASVIGFHTWETVVFIHKGANYGYPLREGLLMMLADGTTSKLPDDDTIPVHATDLKTIGTIAPTYAVLRYGHGERGGDAIAGGFVYQGTAIPGLRDKYILGDTSTGRVWYADIKSMIAADDNVPDTVAEMHELKIAWDDPQATSESSPRIYDSMRPIVEAGYHARGGKDSDLPGTAAVSGAGRVDLRFAVDRTGELYLLSKSDGMVRKVVSIAQLSLKSP
jgi:Glucose / Sorbosone dehydrogenase